MNEGLPSEPTAVKGTAARFKCASPSRALHQLDARACGKERRLSSPDLQPATAILPAEEQKSDEDERRRLEAALDDGIVAARRGDHVDGKDFIDGLLAR